MARAGKRLLGSSPQPAEAASQPEFASLAHIVRVRGRVGEVAANVLTDFPERLPQLREVFLLAPSGRRRAARVRRCWLSSSRGGQAIFHFEGVSSIEEAQKLVGCEVQIPLADRAPLPAGRYYVSDLAGCEVFEVERGGGSGVPNAFDGNAQGGHGFSRAEGADAGAGALAPEAARLGVVRDVYFESGTPLLTVETPRGELLIPLADEICLRIDVAARRIEVRLPEGLRELNG